MTAKASMSVESTYKELKLDPWENITIERCCLESTYKELKRISKFTSALITPGLESTYKELKHRIEENIRILGQ